MTTLRDFFRAQTGRDTYIDASGPIVNQMAEFAEIIGQWLGGKVAEVEAAADGMAAVSTSSEKLADFELRLDGQSEIYGELARRQAHLEERFGRWTEAVQRNRAIIALLLDCLAQDDPPMGSIECLQKVKELAEKWDRANTLPGGNGHGPSISMDATVTPHCEVCEKVRAEIKASGHEFEGTTLDRLVDRAIDRERLQRDQVLGRIYAAAASGLAGTESITELLQDIQRMAWAGTRWTSFDWPFEPPAGWPLQAGAEGART